MDGSVSSANPPANQTIGRARVSDQIIDAMRDQILRGHYPRGSRLPTERDLALEFGVSSPTIREALRALTSMGLVEVRHGSGAYVRKNTDGILTAPLAMVMQLESVGVEEIIGLVQVLILHAADIAVETATDADIKCLTEAVALVAASASGPEVEKSVSAFLVSIGTATHQPLLEALIRFLATMLVRLETASLKRRPAKFWIEWASTTTPMRLAVVDALERRDAAELKLALSELYGRVRERVRAIPAMRNARLSDPVLSAYLREIVVGNTAT
jgi:GntR family transcriptional repressor for pyruvate dehydrogenase complex